MKPLLAVPLAVGLFAAAAGAQAVQPGDSPKFTLKEAFNTMGATSVEDFRGKPVLIDFWGTR